MGLYLGFHTGMDFVRNENNTTLEETIKTYKEKIHDKFFVLYPVVGGVYRKNKFQIKAEVGVPILKPFEKDSMKIRDTFNTTIGLGYQVANPLTVSLLLGLNIYKFYHFFLKPKDQKITYESKSAFYTCHFTLGGEIALNLHKHVCFTATYKYLFRRKKDGIFALKSNTINISDMEINTKNKISGHRITSGLNFEF